MQMKSLPSCEQELPIPQLNIRKRILWFVQLLRHLQAQSEWWSLLLLYEIVAPPVLLVTAEP